MKIKDELIAFCKEQGYASYELRTKSSAHAFFVGLKRKVLAEDLSMRVSRKGKIVYLFRIGESIMRVQSNVEEAKKALVEYKKLGYDPQTIRILFDANDYPMDLLEGS